MTCLILKQFCFIISNHNYFNPIPLIFFLSVIILIRDFVNSNLAGILALPISSRNFIEETSPCFDLGVVIFFLLRILPVPVIQALSSGLFF